MIKSLIYETERKALERKVIKMYGQGTLVAATLFRKIGECPYSRI